MRRETLSFSLLLLPLLSAAPAAQLGLPELTQLEELVPASAQAGDQFGASVALSGDLAVIGAPMHDVAPAGGGPLLVDAGAAFVYQRSGAGWSLLATLTGSQAQAGDQFGWAVAIEGQLIAVGAPGAAPPGLAPGRGRAYVFQDSPILGIFERQILDGAPNPGGFGAALAIEGGEVFVGASPGAVGPSGSVYVYKDATGLSYALSQELNLNVCGCAQLNNAFGRSLAVSGDTLMVGAHRHGGAQSLGRVFVFERASAASPFGSNPASLDQPSPKPCDFFGHAIALEGDVAVIGAYNWNEVGGSSVNVGRAFEFRRMGTQFLPGQELGYPNQNTDDQGGFSVALSGSRVFSGVRFDDIVGTTDAGSVATYDLGIPGTSKLVLPSSPQQGELFGYAMAAEADTLLVGATQAGPGATPGTGRVRVFQVCDDGPGGGSARLVRSPAALSVSNVGTCQFELRVCPSSSTGIYLLLGSASGTQPGFPVGGVTLPLNLDPLLMASVQLANSTELPQSLGSFGPGSVPAPQFVLPPGALTTSGFTWDFACLVLSALGQPVLASNAVSLEFVP